MSTPGLPPPNVRPAFQKYRAALQAISARTGTPVSSLVVSFGVLHELTAIVPLVGLFFGARALGIGERIVDAIQSDKDTWAGRKDNWVRMKCGEWVDEGQVWAQKVGRRYGVFGYEKRNAGEEPVSNQFASNFPSRLAGDAANAIVAYGLTKVCKTAHATHGIHQTLNRPCFRLE